MSERYGSCSRCRGTAREYLSNNVEQLEYASLEDLMRAHPGLPAAVAANLPTLHVTRSTRLYIECRRCHGTGHSGAIHEAGK